MKPLTVWVPRPPDIANGRGHWATLDKERRRYVRELRNRQLLGYQMDPPPATPIPFATLVIDWHYPDRRHHLDPDNCTRRLKPVVDFLVSAGYLAGDTALHVRWLPVVEHVGEKRPDLCTVKLTIIPSPRGSPDLVIPDSSDKPIIPTTP